MAFVSSEVNEALKAVKAQLESLASKIVKNDKIVDPNTLTNWKNNMVDISRETALLNKENDLLMRELANMRNSTGGAQLDANQIRLNISNELKRVDIDSAQHVREIRSKLKIAHGCQQEDEPDIEEVSQGFTEQSFNCPYTQRKFIQPMKNSSCSHRIDKASLQSILRGGASALCPIAGCNKKWTTAAQPDEDFKYEMDRFFRVTQSQTQSQGSVENVQSLDDEEYTNV